MTGMGAGPVGFASAWLVMAAAMMVPAVVPVSRVHASTVARAGALWLAVGAGSYALLQVAPWQVSAVVGLGVACAPGVASSGRCGALMLAMVATGATGVGWMAAATAVLLALRAAPVRARRLGLALAVPVAALVLLSARPPASMSVAAAAQPDAHVATLCRLAP